MLYLRVCSAHKAASLELVSVAGAPQKVRAASGSRARLGAGVRVQSSRLCVRYGWSVSVRSAAHTEPVSVGRGSVLCGIRGAAGRCGSSDGRFRPGGDSLGLAHPASRQRYSQANTVSSSHGGRGYVVPGCCVVLAGSSDRPERHGATRHIPGFSRRYVVLSCSRPSVGTHGFSPGGAPHTNVCLARSSRGDRLSSWANGRRTYLLRQPALRRGRPRLRPVFRSRPVTCGHQDALVAHGASGSADHSRGVQFFRVSSRSDGYDNRASVGRYHTHRFVARGL